MVPSARSLIVAAVLVLAAGGLYGLARETSMFAISAVEVKGASPTLAAQARGALRPFLGTSLLRLNGAAVVRRLEDLPAVRTATFDRDFPHTLRVFIVQERPAAVLRQGVHSWVVSGEGRVLAGVDRSAFPGLPRIWLPTTAAVDLGAVLPEDAGGAAARALATISASGLTLRLAWARVEGGQLTLGLRSGLELRFGAANELQLKTAIVKGILPTLSLPSAGGPTYLDVSVVERPVAGRNPQP